MDIPSFISLLSNSGLTFVRSDLFEDKFEGTLPKLTAQLLDSSIQHQIQSGELKPIYQNFSQLLNQDNKTTYLNCWSSSDHEMIHMWKIYSKENGVAIETDYNALKSSIQSKEDIYPTEIQYINYNSDYIDWQSNAMTAYTIKRKEYFAEKEFRLILSHPREVEDKLGKYKTHEEIALPRVRLYNNIPIIKCDVDVLKLIKQVHLSPYAPKWYYDIIYSLMQKYGLSNIKLISSEL